MTTRLLPLLLLSFLSLAHADGERIRYACDNGSRLDISFWADGDGRPQATLHFADGEIVLPGVPAASGALYRAGEIRLHTKGDDARVEDGRGNTRNCTRGDAPAPAAAEPAAAGSFLGITGSVTYLAKVALPPDAVLIVRIQDTSRAGAPARTLSEQRIELAGAQVPIPFRATIDRDLVGKRARITVSARIERGGKLLFINDTSYPAVVDGKPQHVDMTLKPVGATRKR